MSNIKKYQQPTDENGKRHGEWFYYDSYDKLLYRWNYIHGVPHGLWEEYNYVDNKLMYRGNYYMGIQVGYWCNKKIKKYFLCLI